jgi:toxin FitB
MYLLDTNVVSELMRERPIAGVLQWLDEQSDAAVFICAITHCEIALGLALMPEGKKQRQLALQAAQILHEEFTDRCLELTAQCGTIYAHIVASKKAQGHPISTEDAMIAGIALNRQLILVTRNTKDFQGIAGLSVINPWAAA